MSVYGDDVRGLLSGELQLNPTTPSDFAVALELQKQHGLLTNDSLLLAVAHRLGIAGIATTDSHFDDIPGLIIYKPDDLIR
jgi:predicted nucleic acid-binding protein